MLAEIPSVDELLSRAKEEFVKRFGCKPEVAASAPGRVNIIGEHTDYNDGLVLPMALPLQTVVVGKANGTNKCRISTLAALDCEEQIIEFDIPTKDKLLTANKTQWGNYIKGVIAFFKGNVVGFDMTICSSVPIGGGVSSSASLEVATYTFLEGLTSTTSDLKEKALACQRAEHEFAGMPCGIMDQFISTMGKENHALMIDCRSLEGTLVKISNQDVVFLIINSNVKHKLTGSEYPQRRAQCQNAALLLGEPSLRSVPLEELEMLRKLQVDNKTINRAEHVISEIKRTAEAAIALQNNDFKRLGKLMNESHDSLKILFEVSCPEIDQLVDIARSIEGVYGSRMTGGGFGGCTVSLVNKADVDVVIKAVSLHYSGTPTFYMCRPADGAKLHKIN